MIKLVEFREQNVVFAKNQPQYRPLPAHIDRKNPKGRMTCCWKLGFLDRVRIAITGKIWHQVLTFNEPLQPQLLLSQKPELNQ